MTIRYSLLVFSLLVFTSLFAVNPDSLRSSIASASDKKDKVNLYFDLGTFYQIRNIDSTFIIIKELRDFKDDEATLAADLLLSSTLFKLNKYDSAISVAFRGKQLSAQLGNIQAEIDLDNSRAKCYYAKGVYSLSHSISKRNFTVSDSLDYLDGQGNALVLMANIFIKQGELDSAMLMAKQAFEIYSLSAKSESLVVVHQLLGNVHLLQQHYPEAQENFLKALTKAEEIEDYLKVSEVLDNLGEVHRASGNFEQAESYFLRSKKVCEEIRDSNGVAKALLLLGDLWVESRPLRAEPYYDEALQIYRSSGNEILLGQALIAISSSYYKNKRYQKSLAYSLEAIEVQRNLGAEHEMNLALMNLGYAYMKLNDKANAEESFTKSLSVARQGGNVADVGASLMGMGDFYEHFKDYELANEFRKQYILHKDSLIAQESVQKSAELQEHYETQLKEQQIETLTRESELAELRKKKQQLAFAKNRSQLVFFLSFFFVFLLMIYSSYKRLKFRKQHEQSAALIIQQKAGLKAIVRASEVEKRKISTSLTDGVSQTISGVKLALDQLKAELDFPKDIQEKRFSQSVMYLDEANTEIKSIAEAMVPATLMSSGLVVAVQKMIKKTLSHTNVKYQFEYFGISEKDRFNKEIEINLFKACQELVMNAAKHSGAKSVSIQLLRDSNEIVVNVEDDGLGMSDDKSARGQGLGEVQARIASLDGNVIFEKAQTSGLHVSVRVPLNENIT